jgi:peptidyl-prolyl cis-trans isomerase B (cyclophilin B)
MDKKLIFSVIALVLVVILIGYVGYGYYQKQNFELKRPIVSMEIEGYGMVKMELYPEEAPETVKNFVKLINEGYYNGLTFHRIEADLLIQGGDPAGTGAGSSEYSVPGEFTTNGYENNLKFERGTVGLARQDFTSSVQSYGLPSSIVYEGYNTGYSQFFIMTVDQANFDGLYTSFGKVIEGIEIIDELSNLEAKVEVDEETGEEVETAEPVNKPVITNMTVDTFNIKYDAPNLVKTFDFNSYIMSYFGLS